MGPGSKGGEEEFLVEEEEPAVYNPTGVEPPVWQPAPKDILLMFEQLEREPVLPLKWVCPGRRPPDTEAPEQQSNVMSHGDSDDDDKEEEKRIPEPSAFDFDDTASESSAKVKMAPRTPAQGKRTEKKVACMYNIISSMKRQQKAEREARKSHVSGLGMSGAFRGPGSSAGGTPTRVGAPGFSPSTSPRVLSTTASPGPGSPRGSPRVSAPTTPTSSRLDNGETTAERKAGSGEQNSPPETFAGSSGLGIGNSVADREKVAVCEVLATELGSSTSAPAAVSVAGHALPPSVSSGGEGVGTGTTAIKVEQQECSGGGGGGGVQVDMLMVTETSEGVVVKQEG